MRDLRADISAKNIKLLDEEKQLKVTESELYIEKRTHSMANKETIKWKKEYETANKKHHHYMQLCGDKDVSIKMMDIEISRLRDLVPTKDKKRKLSSEEESS